MIAGVVLAAHLAIDTGRLQALRDVAIQQEEIEPQAGVACPALAHVIPK